MVTTSNIRSMIGSNGDMNSLSNLKIEPPSEIGFPKEFGMDLETRDDDLGQSSRSAVLTGSDRRSKRYDGNALPPKTPKRHRQEKSTPTSRDMKHRGRGEKVLSVSSPSRRSISRTRQTGSKSRRERSQSFQNSTNDNPDCETGAFDYTPLVVETHACCDEESSEAFDFPSSEVSASSKLLGTTSSATTALVNNVTSTPKKTKVTSPKKMTSNDTNDRARTAKPKVTIVGKAKVYSRNLIQPKVYHSTATGLWISTITTSSQSSDNVKAFSFRTEQEARASAYANAPPVMIPLDNCTECMLCDNKFSLLRRRKNCRNCGICICTNFSCSTNWRAKMVPETYNVKKTKTVKVCTSCDSLAKRFQHSLLEGRYETALELYLTGNINLRVPFAFKSEKEDMFPVHCAIKGKSEKLLRWLVETQCCPLQMFATSNKVSKSSKGTEMENYLPSLTTSKGKTILDLAMESKDCAILRFLVKEKDLSVFEVKDLDVVLRAMDALIKEKQPTRDESKESKVNSSKMDAKKGTNLSTKDKPPMKEKEKSTTSTHTLAEKVKAACIKTPVAAFPYDTFNFNSSEESDEEDEACIVDHDDESVCTTLPDVCTICNEKNIDCVAAPCGHQMCCLKCSKQLRYCPVCSTSCQFISIYQP